MIHYYRINDAGQLDTVSTADLADWIHLESASEAEMLEIIESYDLPPDYLYSTLDPDEVSRAEHLEQENVEQPVLILFLYPLSAAAKSDPGNFHTRALSIILLPKLVITCSAVNPLFMDDLANNRFERVSDLEDIHGIIIEIAWRIASSFVLASKEVRTQMDQLQSKLQKSTKTEHLLKLAALDKSIIYLNTAIEENNLILKKMSQLPYLTHGEQEKAWLHDVMVENHQASCMSAQTRRMLAQLDATFSSIIQNNLNVIMKVLTSLTIIITIPTIISGYWGMNVNLPFMHHELSFAFILILTVVLMIVAIYLLRRKDLL